MKQSGIIAAVRNELNPHDVDVVIYHSPCPDGYGAAMSAFKRLGDKASYIPKVHKDKTVDFEAIKGKNVLIADFSFDKEVIEKMRSIANKVIILDHHASAQKALSNVPGCFFDMKHSGAVLTWQYFHDQPCPEYLRLIEDRDIWKWDFKARSEPFSTALIQMMEACKDDFYFNFRQLEQFEDTDKLNAFIKSGKAVLEKEQLWVEQKAKHANAYLYTNQDGRIFTVRAIQLDSYKLSSELGNALCEKYKCDFAMVYHQLKDSRFKVSLRSIKDIDVSFIASQLGGGGHKKAAGFIQAENPLSLLKSSTKELLWLQCMTAESEALEVTQIGGHSLRSRSRK